MRRRVAGGELDLAGCEGRAQAAHDVLEALLVGHQGVRVALHDHDLAGLASGALGAVDEVERAALVEEERRRRVEVLGAPLAAIGVGPFLAEDAPAEAGGSAGGVADGEDDASPEAVVDARPAGATALAAHHEPGLEQLLLARTALRDERSREALPGVRRPAQLVGRDGLVVEAATAQVIERRLAELAARERRVVEGDGRLEHLAQALALRVLARRALVELDPGARGQAPQGLGEVDPVALHDEAEDVAALAAAEAVPRLARGRDHERRGLLPVERAEPLERGAGLLQLDRLADELDEVRPVLDGSGDACGRGGNPLVRVLLTFAAAQSLHARGTCLYARRAFRDRPAVDDPDTRSAVSSLDTAS